jgi:hypothetical protein
MSNTELSLTLEDYDKAFTEVSFLLDIFIETIVTFVGKSTPALAVAAGRKMAANLPVHLEQGGIEEALMEVVRVFRIQQMEIAGRIEGTGVVIDLKSCPIGSVCRNRGYELGGEACQMFHYYFSGIMAELTGRPARPKTISVGEQCSFAIAFSGAAPMRQV